MLNLCPCTPPEIILVLMDVFVQIGSYYGSEIAPVDLDDDGVTDNLLVAAPMFFSGGWEKGKVYIYRVTEQVKYLQPFGIFL